MTINVFVDIPQVHGVKKEEIQMQLASGGTVSLTLSIFKTISQSFLRLANLRSSTVVKVEAMLLAVM